MQELHRTTKLQLNVCYVLNEIEIRVPSEAYIAGFSESHGYIVISEEFKELSNINIK